MGALTPRSETWRVCAGDPTRVQIPGVAKPILCGSKERARLIAAAPDLLAFVQGIANHDPVFAKGSRKQEIADARALIAKTKGP